MGYSKIASKTGGGAWQTAPLAARYHELRPLQTGSDGTNQALLLSKFRLSQMPFTHRDIIGAALANLPSRR